jgi:hypothetical protein
LFSWALICIGLIVIVAAIWLSSTFKTKQIPRVPLSEEKERKPDKKEGKLKS